MAVDHGIAAGRRTGYDMTGRDRARFHTDLQGQRARVAAELAGLVADVHAGRRRMNQLTLEAVGQAARRLADLDRDLAEGGEA
jgi:hypothetical protein